MPPKGPELTDNVLLNHTLAAERAALVPTFEMDIDDSVHTVELKNQGAVYDARLEQVRRDTYSQATCEQSLLTELQKEIAKKAEDERLQDVMRLAHEAIAQNHQQAESDRLSACAQVATQAKLEAEAFTKAQGEQYLKQLAEERARMEAMWQAKDRERDRQITLLSEQLLSLIHI